MISSIRESLSSKRVLLTGVTGFLGTALLERLLTDVPLDRIYVVVRGDAESRLQGVLAGPAFGPARERLGKDFDKNVRSKLQAISADLALTTPEVPSDVDLIIHAAATVSFDPPIDEAFATNLMGTTQLYRAAEGRPFIHISTAYVAGMTRGIQPEEPLVRDVDWRAEADAASRVRAEVVDASRRPEVLETLQTKARREMGKAGPQSVARRAEELRREWINERLVRTGRSRARSLGWPDVYTFTKGLTEIALGELAGNNPLTIVRPSIIESALKHPIPGWIEGFRMADPIMLAYGRGILPEFPGIPDGVLDLIPVDLVVNATIAAAAEQAAEPKRRAIYHVCSGGRNPLRFRYTYDLTREYFLEHPLPERQRGYYKIPEWRFPGRRALERRMSTAERLIDVTEKVVDRIPRSNFARESARRIDRVRRRFDFLKRYGDLYGAYTEAEVIYVDAKAQQLFESLPDEDRRDFPFDPSAFKWDHYLQEVHLPKLTEPLRIPVPTRLPPSVMFTENRSNGSVLAVFDVEGTVVSSNVVEAYLWLRLSELDDVERLKEIATMAPKVPGFLRADRRDRGEFLREFYKVYEGASADGVRKLAVEVMSDLFLRRMAPAATRRIREHRSAGHRVVFVTASLDFVVEPVAPLADEIVSAKLAEVGGIFTGDLDKPPLVGEARASWLQDYALRIGADLSSSYAYADSMSDLPLLEAVGHPVAVSPDLPLTRTARTRGWPIEEWAADKGTPRVMVPEPLA